MPCYSVDIIVRREIDSMNERLTGDGQTIEGGDPNKGAMKTKGTVFTSQYIARLFTVNVSTVSEHLNWEILLKLIE